MIPLAIAPPAPPDLNADVWSESMQQFIDWIDSFRTPSARFEYVAYLGQD